MNGPVICGIEDARGASIAGVARELAERYEVPLLYVHVLDNPGDAEQAARLLREAAAPGRGKVSIEEGHPADRLVELAGERNASFLVLGNHGPRSSLLGSVSADVARRAPCPVIVVSPAANPVDGGVPAADLVVEGGIVRFGLEHAARRVA